jgi:hypothetical protein
MKWIAISGGWRKINDEVEEKVRAEVKAVMQRGNGIISGGALGVDYIALDQALKDNPVADRIKIFLPSTLDLYSKHYQKRAEEGIITKQQADDLINQFTFLKHLNSSALVESDNLVINTETYYLRNTAVIEAADELVAFHIRSENSEGSGTMDTIKKAGQKGIPVKIFKFDLSK